MKRIGLVASLALLASLAACGSFTDKDRAMLKESHDLAVQANEKADKAEAAAKAASDHAAASAKSADKADRIFRAGQNK